MNLKYNAMKLRINYPLESGWKWGVEYDENYFDYDNYPGLNERERYVLLQLSLMHGVKVTYDKRKYNFYKKYTRSTLIRIILNGIRMNYNPLRNLCEGGFNISHIYLTRSLRLYHLKRFDKELLLRYINILDIPTQDKECIIFFLRSCKVWSMQIIDLISWRGIYHKKYDELCIK